MKFKAKDFKFIVKPMRLKIDTWQKYYKFKGKSKLPKKDVDHVKEVRLNMKKQLFQVVGVHVPSGVKKEWTLKDAELKRKDLIVELTKQVAVARKERRVMKFEKKQFEGASYNILGGIFDKPGMINEIGKKTKFNDPYTHKTPRMKNRNYIGIELEFNSANYSDEKTVIGKALKDAGLARFCDVAPDGSCGWEVRALLPEDEFETMLPKILDVINSKGFKADHRCGTHVHFDMRNRDVKLVYNNLFKTQKLLRKFLTRKRKINSSYCKINKHDNFDSQKSLHDRYHGINVESYEKHKTLEVRMHQGTLDADQLIPWIKFLIKICSLKTAVPASVNTLKQAKKQYELEDGLEQALTKKMMLNFVNKIGA